MLIIQFKQSNRLLLMLCVLLSACAAESDFDLSFDSAVQEAGYAMSAEDRADASGGFVNEAGGAPTMENAAALPEDGDSRFNADECFGTITIYDPSAVDKLISPSESVPTMDRAVDQMMGGADDVIEGEEESIDMEWTEESEEVTSIMTSEGLSMPPTSESMLISSMPLSFCISRRANACDFKDFLSPWCTDRDGDCAYVCDPSQAEIPNFWTDCDPVRYEIGACVAPPRVDESEDLNDPDSMNDNIPEADPVNELEAGSPDEGEFCQVGVPCTVDVIGQWKLGDYALCNEDQLVVVSGDDSGWRLSHFDLRQDSLINRDMSGTLQDEPNYILCSQDWVLTANTADGWIKARYLMGGSWLTVRETMDAERRVTLSELSINADGKVLWIESQEQEVVGGEWTPLTGMSTWEVPLNVSTLVYGQEGNIAWIDGSNNLWIKELTAEPRLLAENVTSLFASMSWLMWTTGRSLLQTYPWGWEMNMGSEIEPIILGYDFAGRVLAGQPRELDEGLLIPLRFLDEPSEEVAEWVEFNPDQGELYTNTRYEEFMGNTGLQLSSELTVWATEGNAGNNELWYQVLE